MLDLWQRNLPDTAPGRYEWLYERGQARGWLLRDAHGTAVGATGLMPRSMCVAGQQVPAGQAIDLNIDAEHRTVGPALGLQRAVTATVQQRECALLYAFPNALSEPVLRRVGYRPLGAFERWAKPLRSQSRLPRGLQTGLAGRLAGRLIDALLCVRRPEAFYRRPAGLRVAVVDTFDARFDELFSRAAGQFTVVGERSAEYLTWRFVHSPTARHRAICLSDRQGRLQAYLVVGRQAGQFHIADLFFSDPCWLDALVVEGIRLARRERGESIVCTYLGPDWIGNRLARFGFWKRPSRWNVLVLADEARLRVSRELLLDHEQWLLTRGDVDTDPL